MQRDQQIDLEAWKDLLLHRELEDIAQGPVEGH
jgi:hypothetical protein